MSLFSELFFNAYHTNKNMDTCGVDFFRVVMKIELFPMDVVLRSSMSSTVFYYAWITLTSKGCRGSLGCLVNLSRTIHKEAQRLPIDLCSEPSRMPG